MPKIFQTAGRLQNLFVNILKLEYHSSNFGCPQNAVVGCKIDAKWLSGWKIHVPPNYADIQTNSTDPDQAVEQSDLGLHCLLGLVCFCYNTYMCNCALREAIWYEKVINTLFVL